MNNKSESQELQDRIRILLALHAEYKKRCEVKEYQDLGRDTIRMMTGLDIRGLFSKWGIGEERVFVAIEYLRDNGLVEMPSLRLANLTRRGVEYVERELLG